MTIQDKFDETFLLSGKDLILNKFVKVHHPTVGDIQQLGCGINCERAYWEYVNCLCCDPYFYMVELYDSGIDYETYTNFDMFVFLWKKAIKEYENNKEKYDKIQYHPLVPILNALQFFIGNNHFVLQYLKEINDYVLLDINSPPQFYIDRECFNFISDFIIAVNNIEFNEKIHPANKSTKMMLIEDMRDEQKRKQKEKQQQESINIIGDIISGVCFGGNGSLSIANCKNIKIYWLFKAMQIINNRDTFNHTLNGVYAGTVDFKTVSEDILNWKK